MSVYGEKESKAFMKAFDIKHFSYIILCPRKFVKQNELKRYIYYKCKNQ